MGYSITIGNAVPVHSKEYGELSARWCVEGVRLPDAPTFPNDDMTGDSNGRHPSYSGWAEFCREAGGDINHLFYGSDPQAGGGLLERHPGCVPLTQEHLDVVRAALARRRKSSSKEPGFAGEPIYEAGKFTGRFVDEDRYDGILARLIWLEFWMAWALANCETPAIENT